MGPTPDDPLKTNGDISNVETPQFIAPPGSSDSDDFEDEQNYGGYQLLPQEPQPLVPEEIDVSENSNPSPSSTESALDIAIYQTLNTEGINDASNTNSIFDLPPGEVGAQNAELWNERLDGKEMGKDEADKIKLAMTGFNLPSSNLPEWAKVVPEEEWKEKLFSNLRKTSNTTSLFETKTHEDNDAKR